HTRFSRDWSSDVCSSDLAHPVDRLDPAEMHRDVLNLQGGHVVITSDSSALRRRSAVCPRLTRPINPDGANNTMTTTSAPYTTSQIGRASCRARGAVSGGA